MSSAASYLRFVLCDSPPAFAISKCQSNVCFWENKRLNTPAHIIFAAAVFARPLDRGRTCAAVTGALAPDLSLYVLAGWALVVRGFDASYVFDILYFSETWQNVFKVDNSFFVWGGLLALAAWFGARRLMVFALAALLHLALDFPLHHDDGRPHFWPLTDWVFESPVSYWDTRHHAAIVGPVEVVMSLIGCAILAYRFTGWPSRLMIAALALTQVFPAYFWLFVFSTNP